MMPALHSGTVTVLFTDIEGSTALWERDRTAMAAAVERHEALLDTAIQHYGGVHFKTVGNAVQVAFPPAPQSVAAAVNEQSADGRGLSCRRLLVVSLSDDMLGYLAALDGEAAMADTVVTC